jgi:single-strand DNA-binding protein
MLNRAILMGRLTADPELKTTPTNVSVVSFTLAVDRNYVKQGEERKADFINCVAWRNSAEFLSRYFSKGSMVAVEGQIQTRTYQAKDGTNRYVTEVVVDNISFTGERRDNSGSQYGGNQFGSNQYGGSQFGSTQYGANQSYQAPAPASPAQPSYQSGSSADFQDMPMDDDLPF